jgi:hypothetical protein
MLNLSRTSIRMSGFRSLLGASALPQFNFATGPQKDVKAEPRFLEQVEMFFNRAAAKTNIPADYLEMIRTCDNVIRFTIPLRRDNGKIEMINCYRA